MHHAGLVLEFVRGDKLIRVHDDVFPAIEIARIDIQDQRAGLDGDDDTHEWRDFEAAGADDTLVSKKNDHQPANTSKFIVGVDGEERQGLKRLAPQAVGNSG